MRRHGVGEGAVHVTVRCAGTINASVGAHARTDAKTNEGSYLSVNQHRGHRRLRDAPDRPAHDRSANVFFRHTGGSLLCSKCQYHHIVKPRGTRPCAVQ